MGYLVQRDDLPFARGLAGEQAKLARQAVAPVGRNLDLHQIVAYLRALRGVNQEEIDVPDDGCEEIVEVVRDSPRQLTERIHFLHLKEL